MNTLLLRLLLIFLSLSLSACVTNGKPDLKRLYAREIQNTSQPPIIIIHGLMGSTLVDKTTKELAVNWDDDLVKATALTKDGAVIHPNFQPKTV